MRLPRMDARCIHPDEGRTPEFQGRARQPIHPMSHVAQVEPHVVNGGARTTLLFGAVRFELMADFPDVELLGEHALFVESGDGIVVADVSAALHGVAHVAGRMPPEVERTWDGDRAIISVGALRTELAELGRGRFAARADVSPDEVGVSTFISTTTSAVVERLGGVIVHSAAVVFGDRAVLFIGPSGAGKTTAAHHCEGTTWLARDRSAVVPFGDGYITFGMPGGDDIDLPRAARAVHRLAGIGRIRRDRPENTVEPLDPIEALATLRESTFAGGDEAMEEQRLDSLVALMARVPVVNLHTKLGASLTSLLGEVFP